MLEYEENSSELETEILNNRSQFSTDQMNISFGEFINLYKNKELIISSPKCQKLFRWTETQKTALIESILLSMPIPPIFVLEDEEGIWELFDGFQRISTILSFFGELDNDNEQDKPIMLNNKWKLVAGGSIKGLEGLDIDNLPLRCKINLKRAVCRVVILRGENVIFKHYKNLND